MKGTYTLLIKLSQPRDITFGRIHNYRFKAGYYAYVGSALNGLEQRIGRHLRKEKRLHWHIDFLLQYAEICGVIYAESGGRQECRIAAALRESLVAVPGFGSSDCRCLAHLFYSNNRGVLKNTVLVCFRSAGLAPDEYPTG
jgi:Uri superfamily endonuclease